MAKLIRIPIYLLAGFALYLVFHFQLALAYSALALVYKPLVVLIPLAVLYVVYRRDELALRFSILSKLFKLIYWLWTWGMVAAAMTLALLVDPVLLVVATIAAAVAIYVWDRGVRIWFALIAFVVAVTIVVLREPWLIGDLSRWLFGLIMLLALIALFATHETARITRFDFAVFVLLAPLFFSFSAFYRGPAKVENPDGAVTFLYEAGGHEAPDRVRAGLDLRFALPDCDGALLLGGASTPGLELLSEPPQELDRRATGDNLITLCDGRGALLYGTRTGQVVFRPADGEAREYEMGSAALMVQADVEHYRAFAMDRYDHLVSLRLPNLSLLAERRGGVNIDIHYMPYTGYLYRSVLGRGLEMIEPGTLEVVTTLELPYSVGGTMTHDERNGILYLSDWLGERIHALGARDLTRLAELPAERGVRQLAYSPEHQLLLAGSYFRGRILVYDPIAGRGPRRIDVGRRVRGLTIDGGQCRGVSAAGVFTIDLPQLQRSLHK
ncbi:MAG TPA: hypothetical protein PKW95_12120 [bacterium]|nr:hypothetical protein [bacterium]